MPYDRQIPDAPIAGSMLPRATELTLEDILVLIQPGNPIGQKNKALTLQVLASFLAAEGHLGPLDIRKTLGQASYITKLDGDKVKVYAAGPSGTSTKYLELGFDSEHNVCRLKIGDDAGDSYVEVTDGSVKVSKTRPNAGPFVTSIDKDGNIRIRSYATDGTSVVKRLTLDIDNVLSNGTRFGVNGLSLPHWLEVGGNLSVAKSLKFAPILTLKVPSGSSEYSVSATLDDPDSYPDGISKSDIDFDGSVVMFVSDSSDSKVLGGLGLFGNTSVTIQGGCGVTLVRKTVGTTARWVPFG